MYPRYFNILSKNGGDEWIPPSLRLPRALSMALFCWTFAASLQGLQTLVTFRNGIKASDTVTANAITYLPTVGTVGISLAWKAIAGDIKNIVPWSTISQKWSNGSNSIFLDYITIPEVLSVFVAIRKRHWTVFMVLISSFLCGALVAFANSLTVVDPFSSVPTETSFEKKSRFSFNGTLATRDHTGYWTLSMPQNYLGTQPYAAVLSERLSNGIPASWTKDNIAFHSFHSTSAAPQNAIMEATVQSFSPDMNCFQLSVYESSLVHTNGTPAEYCAIREPSDVQGIVATLGVAPCWDRSYNSQDSAGLIAQLATNKKVMSFVCKPKFSVREARLSVNATTYKVISYSFTEAKKLPVSIPEAPVEVLWAYLQNPIDIQTQNVLADVRNQPNGTKRVSFDYIEGLSRAGGNTVVDSVDPFFALLGNGQIDLIADSYFEAPERFLADIENLGNSILTQVVSAFARANVSEPVPGTVWTTESRIFLRQTSLRTLQSLLILAGVGWLLIATYFRPHTVLGENPGSLAAMAVALSVTNSTLEYTFANHALSSDRQMAQNLQGMVWRLQKSSRGCAVLDFKLEGGSPPEEHADYIPVGVHKHKGWHPLPLRVMAKVSVTGVLLAVMTALVVLLRKSQTSQGICNHTTVASGISSVLPTAILLLLGYACSGIDGSVRAIASYESLWKGSKKLPLLLNLRDTPSIWIPFRAAKAQVGIAVIASSVAMLLIPAVKVTAAGLYGIEVSTTTLPVKMLVDKSLANNFETAANSISQHGNVQRAFQFTEWTMVTPFNVPQRSGILENLVFSNLTDAGLDQMGVDLIEGASADINVPAISIDVVCNSIPVALIGAYTMPSTYNETNWTFWFDCTSNSCNNTGLLETMRYALYRGERSDFWGSIARGPLHGHEAFQAAFAFDMLNLQTLDNITKVDLDTSNMTWVQQENFNQTVPQMFVAACTHNVSLVNVDARFRYRYSVNSNITGQWDVSDYNRSTMAHERQYSNSRLPSWLAPYPNDAASDGPSELFAGSPGTLMSQTLWPTGVITATNFFELLAAHAEYELKNMSAYRNITTFLRACETVYTAYATQLITEMRPFAQNFPEGNGSSKSLIFVNATLTSREARIVQNPTSTFVLIALLGTIFCCFVWVFLRFPSQSILPKNPGSIGARASFLAGSNLVQRLRNEQVAHTKDTAIWEENSGLGWWSSRVSGRRRSEETLASETRQVVRWGIDTGEGCAVRNWNNPPYSN